MWEVLLGVVVGAAITGGVEWWATPRIQRRIRRDDRRADAIEELITLLREDVPGAVIEVRTAWQQLDRLEGLADDPDFDRDPDTLSEAVSAQRAVLDERASRLQHMLIFRFTRIVMRAGLANDEQVEGYRHAAMFVPPPRGIVPPSDAQAGWEREEANRRALVGRLITEHYG